MERIRKGNDFYGECEVCDASHTDDNPIRITVHYGNMWFCDSCWEKESTITKDLAKNDETKSIVENTLRNARIIDNAVQVRPDVFNAETVAIISLKAEIDNNPEITNKPYTLAETVKIRLEQFKTVAFGLQEQLTEVNNKQKADIVYLNNLANSLRVEEREKLKIADISYQPTKVKPVKPATIKTTGTRKSTKLDKTELRKYAAELGVAEFTLQMLVVSKGITVEAAAKMLKASIDAARNQ